MRIAQFLLLFLLFNAFLLSSVEMHAQYAEDSPENTENESNIIYDTIELNEEYEYAEYDDEYENSESMPDVEIVSDYKEINSYFIDTFFTTDRTPFDSKLREKYNSKDYDYEFGKDGQNYFNNLKDWISNLIAEFFDINDSKEIDTISNYIETIFYIILFGILVFIIFKIIVNKEGRGIFKKKSKKISDDNLQIEEEMQSSSIGKTIEKYISEGDYRMAVRYYYAWTLKHLNEIKQIRFTVDKTSDDYLKEIKSETLKNDFHYVSYLYTYIWYGNFEIKEIEFRQIENKFQSILQNER